MARMTVRKTENDGRQWYLISGLDTGTGYEFENEAYAVCNDGTILDCDGCPITDMDTLAVAVENAVATLN